MFSPVSQQLPAYLHLYLQNCIPRLVPQQTFPQRCVYVGVSKASASPPSAHLYDDSDDDDYYDDGGGGGQTVDVGCRSLWRPLLQEKRCSSADEVQEMACQFCLVSKSLTLLTLVPQMAQ